MEPIVRGDVDKGSGSLRRHIAQALAVLAGALVATTELGFGFMSAGDLLVAFALLGGLGFFLSMATFRLLKRQWIAAQRHGMCLLALIAAIPISHRIKDHHAEVAKDAAQPIIMALGEYRNNTGSYPACLSALTPRYLHQIAEADEAFFRRRPYAYSLGEDGASYNLGFDAPGGYGYSLTSGKETWVMHD